MHGRRLGTVGLILAVVSAGCGSGRVGNLAAEELDEVRRASRAYMEAWLLNDAEAVMATFVSEPVLSPSGLPFLEGQEAARAFWWPENSPPATVTRFEYEELEATGSGDLGFVRGTFTLEFQFDGETYTNLGKYLHLVKRVPGEGWRISHHFWNDLPPQEEQ